MFKPKMFLAAALAAAMTLGTVSSASAAAKPFKDVYANTSFRLLKNTAKSRENCLISPLSAMVAVNAAQIGASGATRREMEKAFGGLKTKTMTAQLSKLVRRCSSEGTFHSLVSVWSAKDTMSVRKAYSAALRKAYGAEVHSVPFNAKTVKDINQWISRETEGRIPSIIDQLNPDDLLVIVNATCFQENWISEYSRSVKRKFTCADGRVRKVDMLEGTEDQYFEVGGAKCFVKPYYQNWSFVAILPKKGTSVKSFLSKTSGAAILKAYRKRQTSNITVKTRLPKFEYEFSASLKAPLKKLGIRSAFKIGSSSTFRNMTSNEVHIDEILQKTYISLDEKGTTAAAATADIMEADGVFLDSPKKIKKVYLNRPFLYEIVETSTGLPIFIGIVNQL